MKARTLVEAAAQELGVTIGALLESPATVTTSEGGTTARWIVRLTFEGPLTGALSVGIGAEDAATLARLVMGLDDAPPEAAISDTLLEVCSQAMVALGERDDFKALRLSGSRSRAGGAGKGAGHVSDHGRRPLHRWTLPVGRQCDRCDHPRSGQPRRRRRAPPHRRILTSSSTSTCRCLSGSARPR